ncbi:hypothetical protein GY21_13535 [Cryobacterium roopkundense]|uniref:Uncharacterized protein n=1 Tax=Cryobacterium roopkundense TaxID=1001240 RepID=A0A099J2T8_9MICO|nr:hypothetical protein [Cryobacterium roopkundense]KGJ72724.1 hypothetical protein GY21_13535 [Cryobacterium roopkundense]MBB5641790.1 hypothetical protein [Cryobacterium roopkundense]
MTTSNLDFNSITGKKGIDQARALRMVLAVLENDCTQSVSVADEVYRDERGSELATWELVVSLAAGLAGVWERRADGEATIDAIREGLMIHAEGKSVHE